MFSSSVAQSVVHNDGLSKELFLDISMNIENTPIARFRFGEQCLVTAFLLEILVTRRLVGG